MRVQFGNTQINVQLTRSKDKKAHHTGNSIKNSDINASKKQREQAVQEYYFRL